MTRIAKLVSTDGQGETQDLEGCCFGHFITKSCLTLFCEPMDCNPPSFSVHGISQGRILEWVAVSFSRGSSQLRDRTRVSWEPCKKGGFFTTEPPVKPSLLSGNCPISSPLPASSLLVCEGLTRVQPAPASQEGPPQQALPSLTQWGPCGGMAGSWALVTQQSWQPRWGGHEFERVSGEGPTCLPGISAQPSPAADHGQLTGICDSHLKRDKGQSDKDSLMYLWGANEMWRGLLTMKGWKWGTEGTTMIFLSFTFSWL